MKDYTVNIQWWYGGSDYRNDFTYHVKANDVLGAADAAKKQLIKDQEIEASEYDDEELEILDIYEGHHKSLWDRSTKGPVK